MSRSRAAQLIDASSVCSNLCTNVDKPKSEFVARPLSKVEPEKQAEVWQEAVETAPEGKPTAKHVAAVAHSKCPPPPRATLDAIGRAVPQAVLPLWNRKQEAQDLLTSLSTIRSQVQKAQDARDPFFSGISFSSVKAHLDQAYAELKTLKPFAVCTTCQGLMPDKCTFCKGRGYLSEFEFKQCVPQETKDMLTKKAA